MSINQVLSLRRPWLSILGLLLTVQPVQAVDPDQLLPVEQAFALSVRAQGDSTVVASWSIAEGYYMYRERLRFEPLAPGIGLGEPELPEGKVKEDEFFGKMEVYRGQVRAEIPVFRDGGGTGPVELKITSQGCADIGVCYPPQTDTMTVDFTSSADLGLLAALIQPQPFSLPLNTPSEANSVQSQYQAPSIPAPPVVAQSGFVSEQDRLSQLLIDQRFWALPLFFGLGLLLAFTPCVFPMIPILSGIIAGQGGNLTQRRAFLLSLVYVLAMALTYTAAGIGAALAGQNIQVWFQNPWVIVAFSGLFVLLALAMFGFYDLQLPVRWQTRLSELSGRQRGGRYAGVAVMGVLSALIVGPCVAAPLIGILAVIGSTGDVALGGTTLFVMSLGMGAPLLAIGTSAGKLLPRAGPWMNIMKAGFGVLLLALAIWMLERIVPASLAMLLWAALLIVTATFMGALRGIDQEKPAAQLFAKGLGVVFMAYGVLLLVGIAAGGKDPWQPLRGSGLLAGGAVQQTLAFKPIKTVADLEWEIAQSGGRSVMLDFYADWCVSCKEMERFTFSDPAVQAALSNTVLLQADVTLNDADDQALLSRFSLIGPPAILFFGNDGIERPEYRVVGFMGADAFKNRLGLALRPGDSSLAGARQL